MTEVNHVLLAVNPAVLQLDDVMPDIGLAQAGKAFAPDVEHPESLGLDLVKCAPDSGQWLSVAVAVDDSSRPLDKSSHLVNVAVLYSSVSGTSEVIPELLNEYLMSMVWIGIRFFFYAHFIAPNLPPKIPPLLWKLYSHN